VFEALPHVDQLFFESLARGALEAAAHWREHEDRLMPPPPPPRLVFQGLKKRAAR
jgi:hypothetical protein